MACVASTSLASMRAVRPKAVSAAAAMAVSSLVAVSVPVASRLAVPTKITEALAVRVDSAVSELEAGMGEGRFRRSDPRLVLVSAYAAVTGVA